MVFRQLSKLLPVFLIAGALALVVVPRAAADDDHKDPDRHHRHRAPVPAPEPASLALLGTGLVCAAKFYAYKNRNAKKV